MDLTELKQAIIEKIHGLPWEEARWVDDVGVGRSEVFEGISGKGYFHDPDIYPTNYCTSHGWEITYNKMNDQFYFLVEGFHHEYEPEGQPITLSRVLLALHKCNLGWVSYDITFGTITAGRGDGDQVNISWLPLKEDKSTATLEDQSEETILTLNKIFL